jgi:hypothetical protein
MEVTKAFSVFMLVSMHLAGSKEFLIEPLDLKSMNYDKP